MSAPRRQDARARVAQARADADRSLLALRARRDQWSERLREAPYWALLLGGFAAGALAGRVVGRVRPRRETLSVLSALGPLWRHAFELLQAHWAAPAAATPPPAERASAQRADDC